MVARTHHLHGAALRPVSGKDVADLLSGKTKVHMVRCDEAAVRWFGISMAGWNALVSLGATVGSAVAAARGRVAA